MTTNLPASHAKQIADFLQKQRTVRGRIAFVIDATMSREPTWDAAAQLQGEMFGEAAKLGGLEMQVVYFRGADEVGASNWTSDARELQIFMGRIRCDGGYTKYARAFARVREEHQRTPINAVIAIGDMLEEEPHTLYDAVAGLGVPLFAFQEGSNFQQREVLRLREAFQEMARLTKGAYHGFDAGSIAQLRELLRAVAVFATGGLTALADLRTDSARKLLGQLKR
jgi:hypothetical protein